jgi:hypothetical protein
MVMLALVVMPLTASLFGMPVLSLALLSPLLPLLLLLPLLPLPLLPLLPLAKLGQTLVTRSSKETPAFASVRQSAVDATPFATE